MSLGFAFDHGWWWDKVKDWREDGPRRVCVSLHTDTHTQEKNGLLESEKKNVVTGAELSYSQLIKCHQIPFNQRETWVPQILCLLLKQTGWDIYTAWLVTGRLQLIWKLQGRVKKNVNDSADLSNSMIQMTANSIRNWSYIYPCELE